MIIVDTREQANSFVIRYFEENIIPYTEKKLDEGDYKLEGQDNIVIERKQDLLELKNFILSLKNVTKVEILPYHDLGKFKWQQLGCAYPLEGLRTATQEDVERAKEILGI